MELPASAARADRALTPQGGSGPADITITADRYYPDDGLLPTSVLTPLPLLLANLGNLAHSIAYAALVHANPPLANRLAQEQPVKGGRIDYLLDDSSLFELKPASWQYGSLYTAAANQAAGYAAAGGYSLGTWADLGMPTATIAIYAAFTGYNTTATGSFVFGYDVRNLETPLQGLSSTCFKSGGNPGSGVARSRVHSQWTELV